MPNRTALVYHPDYLSHDTGSHPENYRRLESIVAHLRQTGWWERMMQLEPRRATAAEVALIHSRQHIDHIHRMAEAGGGAIGLDTLLSSKSYEVALLATGGVLAAVDAVMKGAADSAFVLARPPGHHAMPEQAMGFCLFNHVAVAARYAQQAHGVERVCIIDWDVHHGNGTQTAFYTDPTVLYISTHQYPWYPWYWGAPEEEGEGEGKGFNLNLPLRAGCGDEEYRAVFEQMVAPRVNGFQPDLLLLSAGQDAHAADPLGRMRLTAEGYRALTRLVKKWAAQRCGGRLVALLEGGYNLQALAESVGAIVGEMIR